MAHLPPAEQIEQSYDLTMMALADYVTRERDARAAVEADPHPRSRPPSRCNHRGASRLSRASEAENGRSNKRA